MAGSIPSRRHIWLVLAGEEVTIPYSDEATPFDWLLDYGFVAGESEAVSPQDFAEAVRVLGLLAPD